MPGLARPRKKHFSTPNSSVFGRQNLRLNTTLLCILTAFLAPEPSHAQAVGTSQQQGVRSYDIGPGPLAEVLNRFAREAGVLLSFDAEALQGRHSSGVQGEHAVDDGFRRLLAGSGLRAVSTGAGRYVVRAALSSISGEDDPARNARELNSVLVTGERMRDEVGHDNVYDKNVTTVYQDREQLQRFQATNPGDVFKGMNGVYSMDTRSSQAITPNIRSISGEGRVPLTIDGTEQSTNIWLHMFGAGNRSYADPALFRSIEVEKGASLSRGIRSGVGGAVNIRTIEPSDIIPAGKSLGVEVKLEASGNSSKPSIDVNSYFGKDYRDVPGAYRFDGTNVSIPAPPPRNKGGGENFNFDSHSGMVAVAGRNEMVDFLLSYSERRQGNYYAGKRNSRKYAGHDPFDKSTTDSYVPNLTKLYYAGDEVFNTASETKTTLLKNNWYLPNAQKIGFQFMRTDLDFGETTPGDSVLMWAYREGAEQARPDDDWASAPRFVFEKPHSELKVDRYKLDYEIKPEDSDWVNLEASLWHTKTTGTRHQTGIAPFGIDADEKTTKDLEFYDWALDLLGPEAMEGYPVPEHDGTIVSNGRQWTSHDRTGFDLSNQMKLADNLQLIVGGSIQREKLDDRVQRNNRSSNGVLPDGASMHTLTDFLGPRSGKREEYSAMMNLTWQPTEWLTLTAGARYMHYSGKDTGTAKRRAAREEKFAALRRKTGMKLTWGELLTDAERQAIDTLSKNEVDTFVAAQPYISDFYQYGTRTPEVDAWLAAIRAGEEFTNGRSITKNPAGDLLFWKHELIVPIKNGKPDSAQNPFANGELNAAESVEHAQDVDNAPKYTTAVNDYYVYERLDEGKAWEAPPEQSGDAWSPVLSATARITEFGSAFVRYAQTTRFPSIFELTSSSIVDGANTEGTLLIDGASKPERSINWEIGYTHNLTQFFPGMELADARISYYNTEIRNFIDRNRYLDIIQFDKRKTSGIELQSRFDTGRFFGSLGATYRLKQKMCDKDYASSMDPYYNRIPQCMTGGFPDTYGGSSLQPKYSIVMALGSRLMNRRLEMGWRGVYHSGAENKQLDSLLAVNTAPPGLDNLPRDMWFRGGQHTFYWKPVLLHDLYARFEVSKDVLLNLNITNLTDEYYIEPMSKSLLPGPGRTVSAGVTIKF